jgi:serine/threonine-protein kinase RsbT
VHNQTSKTADAFDPDDARGSLASELRVAIRSAADIVAARQAGRALAMKLGFAAAEVTVITAAISEIARNIVDHAQRGTMTMSGVHEGTKAGLLVIARDHGPGIPDVARAMEYGYSTGQQDGAGLPGAKWLMDEFDITSKPGKGTTVVMKKWLNRNG